MQLSLQGVSYKQYTQLDTFTATALPILQRDVLRNTLCLTQLNSGKASTLGVLSCSACMADTVLVAADAGLGYSSCYMSSECCQHTAYHLSKLLQEQLQHCNMVTLPAAAAEMLLHSTRDENERWQVDIHLQLMVHTQQPSEAPARDSAATSGCTTTPQIAHATPSAAAAFIAAPSTWVSQQEQQLQPKLELQQCSADSDAGLVVSWCTAFLQEVFHQPERLPQEQVASTVLPRLSQGWYYLLTAGSAASTPLCLVAHTPSSAASTRITMVYTPPDHRGKGHAKEAVCRLVHMLYTNQDYSSICLFADKDNPFVGVMYRAVGFTCVDELQTLERRPGSDAGCKPGC